MGNSLLVDVIPRTVSSFSFNETKAYPVPSLVNFSGDGPTTSFDEDDYGRFVFCHLLHSASLLIFRGVSGCC